MTGRQLEAPTGVTSGFSPRRALSQPCAPQGTWPLDPQLLIHKRLPQHLQQESWSMGPAFCPLPGDIVVSIPSPNAPSPSVKLDQGSSAPHKRSPTQEHRAWRPPPPQASGACQSPLGEHLSTSQKRCAPWQVQERGLEAAVPPLVSPRTASIAVAYSSKLLKQQAMARSPSMPRSPTIDNLNSLADLRTLQGGNSHQDRRPDPQSSPHLVPLVLLAAALLFWCLRWLPRSGLLDHYLPKEAHPRQLLRALLLLGLLLCSLLLARLAFPRVHWGWRAFRLPLPSHYHLNLNLNLSLKGLAPALSRGVRYLAPLHGGGCYHGSSFRASKEGFKGSGHEATWRASMARGFTGSTEHERRNGIGGEGDHESEGEGEGVGQACLPPCLPPRSKDSIGNSPGVGQALGAHKYSNGDRYEGEFYRGRSSGSGVYYFALSGWYEGDWVDGKYDGYGVESWSRGSEYRGQYRQGLREGYGIYRFYTGDVYVGMWSKGQSHGCGQQTCADGSRYLGEFVWGAKHGFGKYIFRNGDVYSGEYFGDKMHGYGVYDFANGHRYEGAWHEGRKQGLGSYTFRNGESRAGIWHRGALETRSTHTPPPPTTPSASTSSSSSSTSSTSSSSSSSVVAASPTAGAGAAATASGPPLASPSNLAPFAGIPPHPTAACQPVRRSVSHSRVLHAVEEARRAARKAADVPRVEDRVTKAVAAADRAASAARVAAAKAASKPLRSSSNNA